MFSGFVPIGSTFSDLFTTLGTGGVPVLPSAAPTFQVFSSASGAFAYLPGSSGTASPVQGFTGLYSYQITATIANGYSQGEIYYVVIQYSVGGQNKIITKNFEVV